MAGVLAVAETRNGRFGSVSGEVVSAARGLADSLGSQVDVAALAGPGSGELAATLSARGADRVLEIDTGEPGPASVAVNAAALAALTRERGYAAAVFAATGPGRDLAPRVAAKLASPLLTDVVAVEADGAGIVATRPVFAGKALARVRVGRAPVLLSVRPNVFAATESPRDAAVEVVAAGGGGDPGGYRVRGFEPSGGDALDVSEAEIVVSGGRGMKDPANWHILADLKDALGDTAALGASRAVVDAGWRPHAEQVGQTGKTVTPKLYFAMAISGAIQHLAGMRTSGVIVAVNRDADAPIFGVADYGIVGDVFEVAPKLAEAIRELRSSWQQTVD